MSISNEKQLEALCLLRKHNEKTGCNFSVLPCLRYFVMVFTDLDLQFAVGYEASHVLLGVCIENKSTNFLFKYYIQTTENKLPSARTWSANIIRGSQKILGHLTIE